MIAGYTIKERLSPNSSMSRLNQYLKGHEAEGKRPQFKLLAM